MASVLILAGASITLEDCKSRSPIDLLSGPVLQAIGAGNNAGSHLYVMFNIVRSQSFD